MKVKELKDKMKAFVEILDEYDEDQEVALRPNTYGLYRFLCVGRDGFVDLSDPVKSNEQEYDF